MVSVDMCTRLDADVVLTDRNAPAAAGRRLR